MALTLDKVSAVAILRRGSWSLVASFLRDDLMREIRRPRSGNLDDVLALAVPFRRNQLDWRRADLLTRHFALGQRGSGPRLYSVNDHPVLAFGQSFVAGDGVFALADH